MFTNRTCILCGARGIGRQLGGHLNVVPVRVEVRPLMRRETDAMAEVVVEHPRRRDR